MIEVLRSKIDVSHIKKIQKVLVFLLLIFILVLC